MPDGISPAPILTEREALETCIAYIELANEGQGDVTFQGTYLMMKFMFEALNAGRTLRDALWEDRFLPKLKETQEKADLLDPDIARAFGLMADALHTTSDTLDGNEGFFFWVSYLSTIMDKMVNERKDRSESLKVPVWIVRDRLLEAIYKKMLVVRQVVNSGGSSESYHQWDIEANIAKNCFCYLPVKTNILSRTFALGLQIGRDDVWGEARVHAERLAAYILDERCRGQPANLLDPNGIRIKPEDLAWAWGKEGRHFLNYWWEKDPDTLWPRYYNPV
ncbi:hypothetical protein GFB49_17565 [Epibacterium sp. SM1979]|uniref:Uncharacterized protein n=1 Tax=Tritonibacter litoralis TaxID=2662264 RepID=A0A843YM55_9RHOB|nr:hypothetical protein [Tritonibacter litoralis]MQQ10279.1 hypothetical protein [Tritonibacter litoralis]